MKFQNYQFSKEFIDGTARVAKSFELEEVFSF